jgi:hypothetical protein
VHPYLRVDEWAADFVLTADDGRGGRRIELCPPLAIASPCRDWPHPGMIQETTGELTACYGDSLVQAFLDPGVWRLRDRQAADRRDNQA